MYSYMEWQGLKSQKWKEKGRKKFQQPALEILSTRDTQQINPSPRILFPSYNSLNSQKNEQNQQMIPKQFTNNLESKKLEKFYSDPVPRQQFQPIEKQIYFERKHLRLEKDGHFEDIPYGIKTYETANKETYDGFILEDEMQRKVRVPDHRNGIGIHYLGDKAYHIPEYCGNFYNYHSNPDGVIPGSNIYKSQVFQNAFHIIQASSILQKIGNSPSDISKIKRILQKDQISRTEQDVTALIEYMQCFQYFEKIKAKYNIEFMKHLCRYLYYKQFGPDQIVNVNRTTFIILSGRVLVQKEIDNSKSQSDFDNEDFSDKLIEMAFGQAFNEFGLQDVQKQIAKTIRQTELACLDFKVIIDLNSSIKSNENNDKQQFLKNLSYFQQFSDNEIKYLAYKMELKQPQKGESIFHEQDQECEWIYFVYKGEYQVLKQNKNNIDIVISRLTCGEIFGEEGFLQYERRLFTVKCLSDSAVLFRILNSELEKKVWQKEARQILFSLVASKLIFRLKRFVQIAQEDINYEDLQMHLQYIKDLNQNPLDINYTENDFQYKVVTKKQPIQNNNDNQNQLLYPISVILKNHRHANKVLNQIKSAETSINKSSELMKYQKSTPSKLADNYPKSQNSQKSKKQLKNIIDPNHTISKVSSNYNYLAKNANQKEDLKTRLEAYISKIQIDDEQIQEDLNDTNIKQDKKEEQFYDALKHYANLVQYQNYNLIESQSNQVNTLNQVYQKLIKEQQQNIKNIFDGQVKNKSENMLRKEYFLKQLKKMQKRLQVLQMIAKGYLTCKFNQYVNEEGEIVDIVEHFTPDDAYELVDGKKQLKFNFIKSSTYKASPRIKFKGFDEQIVEQREKIKVVSDIVAGNITPEEAPFVSEDYSKQVSLRKKLSETIPTPKLVTTFSNKLRINSATFKQNMQNNYFKNPLKIRKLV